MTTRKGTMAHKRKAAPRPGAAADKASSKDHAWKLRLYVADNTAHSLAAVANLKRFCEKYLAGNYEIEVIDLLEDPQRAGDDQILAIPTLVRNVPLPMRRMIGDLSQEGRVLVGLDLHMLQESESVRDQG